MQKINKTIHVITDSLKIIHRLDKWKIPVMMAKALFVSALPFVAIVMSAEIINRLSAGETFADTLLFALVSVGLIFTMTVLGDLLKKHNDVKTTHCIRLYDYSKNEKMMSMDYAQLESPASNKLRARLRSEEAMGFGLQLLLDCLDWIFEALFAALLSVILLLTAAQGYLPVMELTVFILLCVALSVAVSFLRKRMDDKILEKIKDDDFWPDAIIQSEVMRHGGACTYKEGKDVRIYSLADMIHGVFIKSQQFNNSITRMFGNIPSLTNGTVGLVKGLIMGGSYVFMAVFAAGALPLGSIVLLASALYQFTAGVSRAITVSPTFLSCAQSLQMYVEFISTPDSQYKGTLPVEKRSDREYEIEFRGVSFKYPASETYALKNLNLKFTVGKRMAVVGMNGSGKTTMIKLLCRLYDPTEGEILLNGINIAKYDLEEYRSIFSVVFQDFKLFSFTLGENVAAGAESEKPREVAALGKITQCLAKAGISERLEAMPSGLDTYLYKDYDEDGVEVSGGEAQKIAIARALYRDAPFLVMDEPTAALDPVAEYEIYSKLSDIVEDKTAIFISHRLSSCRFCHDIAVFHQGEMVQRGGHDELLADMNGKYFELWNAQAQYYVG